jgi:LDH2 family malate/lactate/ureidoglycolate dehydrogenase
MAHAGHFVDSGDTVATLRIVVLTGAPGVGKTEVGRRLVELYPPPAAVVDIDSLAGIHPWKVDAAFHQLVGANLRACLENYRCWGARTLVLTGVVVPGGIYDELAPLLADPSYEWTIYGLHAAHAVLRQRVLQDAKYQDASQRLRWLHLNEQILTIPGCHSVDTSGLSLDGVVRALAVLEGLAQTGVPSGTPPRRLTVPLDRVESTCRSILEQLGATSDVAARVVEDLVTSELEEYPSHGLLRLPEYAEAIENGLIKPRSLPTIVAVGPSASLVDGQRGFGVLSADAVAGELARLLERASVAVVGLRKSNHIGRLAHLAAPLCRKGYAVLGFANYLGAGQRVPPWGGGEGRFCTNPIVCGFPLASGEPIIVDMTTSVVAEGKVRVAATSGEPVPPGWLIDRNWQTITNPAQLYTNPPEAFLAPLGGPAAYKGYALAVVAEALAGPLTGATFVGARPVLGGNGGFFVGLRLDVLGLDKSHVLSDLQQLADYCLSCPSAPGMPPVRLPGQGSYQAVVAGREAGVLQVGQAVWEQICSLGPRLQRNA